MTCKHAEVLGEKLIKTEFAADVAEGKLAWRVVNFEENEALARKYDVSSVMIVIASEKKGRDVSVKKLGRVLELAGNEEEYLAYLRHAVFEALLEDMERELKEGE